MNLQPFYELRERLVFAAAAGTQLIPEDFRLREAGKKMEAYAKASPVFAKISQLASRLSDGGEEGRSETLLELLGLLDAFLITQAESQVEGEVKDILACSGGRDSSACSQGRAGLTCNEERDSLACSREEDGGENALNVQGEEGIGCLNGQYRNVPYSKLHPLQEALTSTGSGRQALLTEAYEEDPELFSDYRLRPLLVQALGDSYGEIADMVCRWIVHIGSPMLPLLKEGFKADGKRDMVRRVQAISAIGKDQENDFYQKYLGESTKDVREALIHALRFHQGNTSILFDLLKTEKGKLRDGALWSLSFMEGEKALQFWRTYSFADASRMALLLRDSHVSYIPVFLADALKKEAADLMRPESSPASPETPGGQEKQGKGRKPSGANEAKERQERKRDGFLRLLNACTGRMGGEIREALEWMAGESGLRGFRKDFGELMTETVFSAYQPKDEDSCRYEDLAARLLAQDGTAYLEPVFAAALLSRPSSQVYEDFEGCFSDKAKGTAIFSVMQRISYQPGKGYVVYLKKHTDYLTEAFGEQSFRVLEDGLDFRWYPLLAKYRLWCPKTYPEVYTPYRGCDALLYRLKRSDVAELRSVYNEYFYARALREGPSAADVAILEENGWTDFKGFVEKGCERFKETAWAYRVRELIRALPISGEQLQKELVAVKEAWAGKKINGSSLIDRWLGQLKDGASKDDLF